MTVGSLGELEDLDGNTESAAATHEEVGPATELGTDDDLATAAAHRPVMER